MLTIRELIDCPSIGIWLEAGRAGEGRAIKAANVCSEPEPWRWLAAGELLMLPSTALPVDSHRQQLLVQLLDRQGMAGLIVSDTKGRLVFGTAMRETANRLGFPLLQVKWATPFAAVAAHVAEHAWDDLLKVIEVYRACNGADSQKVRVFLSDDVSAIVGVRIELVDHLTGMSLLTRSPAGQDICQTRRKYGPSTGGKTVTLNGLDYFVCPVGGHNVSLWVSTAQTLLGGQALEQLCSFFSAELQRSRLQDEHDADALRENMMEYFSGHIDSETMMSSLARRGLGLAPWRMIDCRAEDCATLRSRLGQQSIPHLALKYDGGASVLVGGEKFDERWLACSGDHQFFDSEPFWALDSLIDAAQSAAWRRQLDSESNKERVHAARRLVPVSLQQAKELVESVLGPLLQYDVGHRSDLVRSTEVFLEANRSWESASTELRVHRQTLRYRLGRVTELTGLRLDCMDDVVDLHVSLKVLRMMDSLPQLVTARIVSPGKQSSVRGAARRSRTGRRLETDARTGRTDSNKPVTAAGAGDQLDGK
ncbi:helix-turn-helix domain-containing protein [Paenarthrobacter sp. 2TAF44]|uniref:helix-turn-helix domain-containing protein n=1 Tax=Paenarthrobacter sp. 2TAF44 TaxID=3233018 RepID=UPI003F94BC5A